MPPKPLHKEVHCGDDVIVVEQDRPSGVAIAGAATAAPRLVASWTLEPQLLWLPRLMMKVFGRKRLR